MHSEHTSKVHLAKHHLKRDSARWTDNYLFNQLIPYIGNKRKLIDLVAEAIHRTGTASGVFFDVFAGSGVVSRLARVLGFRVICNDWEPFTHHYNSAFIIPDKTPSFRKLGGCETVFANLNALPPLEGYFATYYSPANDENPDTRRERMFFTHSNAAKIDAIREKIDSWESSGLLSPIEISFLLSPLIYAVSYVSNTSGVFKGFHCGWGGRTGTALYRIRSNIELKPPILSEGKVKNHSVFCEDASRLAERVEADIAYVDPPYNQHQYGANYHILNTVALWDKPPVDKSILTGGRTVNKAAIRKDWRLLRRSRYCYRQTAVDEFKNLITRLRAKYVLVSYSSDGIIPVGEMIDFLKTQGQFSRIERKYKRYRVSSTRPSARSHNTEFVLMLKKS